MTDAPQRQLTVGVAAQQKSGVNLLQVMSSGHEIEVEDEGSLTVMLPRRGFMEVQYGSRTRRATGGGVLTLGPCRRRTRVKPPKDGLFEACLLKLPNFYPLLGEAFSGGAATSGGDPYVQVQKDAVPALSDLIWYILTDLASEAPVLTLGRPAELADVLVDEHIRKLFEAEALPIPKRGHHAFTRLVRQADDYMRANYPELLSIGDIADAVGVESRQLQSAFRTATGGTPWRHLKAIRLENARLRLLAGTDETTVSGIALDCGFTHLGRFSGLYRATYHEAPSETLRRQVRP